VSKGGKILLFIGSAVFLLTFFSCLRIIVLYWYHLQQAQGSYPLAMALMDKAHEFSLTSYLSGGLHFLVVGIIIMIILNK